MSSFISFSVPAVKLCLAVSSIILASVLLLNYRFVYNCLYVTVGLIRIAETVGLSLLAPRKKINVMLIGNHSAGKSSFINWYKLKMLFFP